MKILNNNQQNKTATNEAWLDINITEGANPQIKMYRYIYKSYYRSAVQSLRTVKADDGCRVSTPYL